MYTFQTDGHAVFTANECAKLAYMFTKLSYSHDLLCKSYCNDRVKNLSLDSLKFFAMIRLISTLCKLVCIDCTSNFDALFTDGFQQPMMINSY